MPLSSPRLDLPYLEPAQAQKHVTHNEALRGLDLLVQLTVEGFEQASPPALPVTGQVYALGAAPSGDWAGQPYMLALREENGWRFTQPKPGWLASQAGGEALRIWTGAAWVPVAAATDNLAGLGINTSADSMNRLAVSSTATLLSHEGGDHRLVINKASDVDTASVLFQSSWAGHAEMGLAGDTDFAIKVSPDGTTWHEALRLDANGAQASGSAVIADSTDTAPGKLLVNGAHGLGGIAPNLADANAAAGRTGFFGLQSGSANAPSSASTWLGMNLHRGFSNSDLQVMWRAYGPPEAVLRGHDGSGFTDWIRMLLGSDVQADATDTTDGKLLAVHGTNGAFGLGAVHALNAPDLNALGVTGFYRTINGTVNAPVSNWGHMVWHNQFDADNAAQIFVSGSNNRLYFRRKRSAVWQDWIALVPEYGTNANGSYIRHPDGTQICWGSVTVSPTPNTPTETAWVFPAAFTGNADDIAITQGLYSSVPGTIVKGVGVTDLTLTGCDIVVTRDNATNTRVRCQAIGRWY